MTRPTTLGYSADFESPKDFADAGGNRYTTLVSTIPATTLRRPMANTSEALPQLRFEITEAVRILRISRATLYERIRIGSIVTQKDGRRTFITAAELHRYVDPSR
jgi:DNA-binding NtrC family response regulator